MTLVCVLSSKYHATLKTTATSLKMNSLSVKQHKRFQGAQVISSQLYTKSKAI